METIKAFKARRPEVLTENETISSYASWKQNLEFHLASSDSFAPFIAPEFTWSIASVTNRGLQDESNTVTNKKSAV